MILKAKFRVKVEITFSLAIFSSFYFFYPFTFFTFFTLLPFYLFTLQKNIYPNAIAAITPARSANNPQVTAWRVYFTLTEPK